MSRSFQTKNHPRACKSYIDQIYKLKRDLEIEKLFSEQFKKETIFLRWIIAVSLGLGFVIGVILSKGFSL